MGEWLISCRRQKTSRSKANFAPTCQQRTKNADADQAAKDKNNAGPKTNWVQRHAGGPSGTRTRDLPVMSRLL